jgi:signal transduction histidine kinase
MKPRSQPSEIQNLEKMAFLGRMASGIAHELTNAITILGGNSELLRDRVSGLIKKLAPKEHVFFEYGLKRGRYVSSSDARQRFHEIKKKTSVSDRAARRIAGTGMSIDELDRNSQDLENNADMIRGYWEMGAAFHDLIVAAKHSEHVVKSVRDLGDGQSSRQDDVDVNETIRGALALLKNMLKEVEVKLDLTEPVRVTANKGELVQVWSNLIKNSCESMEHARIKAPELVIRSGTGDGSAEVRIQDNGPGIPKDILPRLFRPGVSKKVDALSLGPGLGLTIVQRLISSHGGKVSVESAPGRTEFKVDIPFKGE